MRGIVRAFVAITFFALFSWGADTIGIVLMHGKTSTPSKVDSFVGERLTRAGFLVETPEMPWSKSRYLDASFDSALSEIDASVKKLRARGATKIVIAGHSMGANAALAYAVRREGIDAVAMLAPGHTPDATNFVSRFSEDVARAKTMVESGKGDYEANFGDINMGRRFDVRTSAVIYLSYFAPDSMANMPHSASMLHIPLFYAVGTQDLLYNAGSGYIFDKAPKNQKSAYVVVEANHMGVPSAAADKLIAWLQTL